MSIYRIGDTLVTTRVPYLEKTVCYTGNSSIVTLEHIVQHSSYQKIVFRTFALEIVDT